MSLRLTAHETTVWPDGSPYPILHDASIEVEPGQIHALVGPNGAGKSTLFGVLAGDITPKRGEVHIGDRVLSSIRPRELARMRAVLLQQNSVFFSFTVRQVVQMGRAPWARTADEEHDDRAVAAAMVATEVLHLGARSVASLSGGERARVALARVLAQQTPVLLLDEPTAALDLKHQEDVMRVARGRADEGAAVAIVLHDLNAAFAHADRVTLMSKGQVVASGTPSEVLTAERIEAVYDQPVDVFPHPVTGVPIIVPLR